MCYVYNIFLTVSQPKKKKKKTNFSGKFKLKPITSYTYNML